MSKKDFQNGFALGLASGGVVEIEKEEQEKSIDITENGETVVIPDDETTTLSKVTVNVNVPIKEEQEKTLDITENGTTEVTPDEGKALSKVTVNVAIESGGEDDFIGIKYSNFSGAMYNLPKTADARSLDKILKEPDETSGAVLNAENSKCMRYAFANTNTNGNGGYFVQLEEVYVPDKVTSFQYTFDNCINLTTIHGNLSNITQLDAAFRNCRSLDINSILARMTSLTTIGGHTFNGCTQITKITLPATITGINSSAFSGCTNVTDIYCPWEKGAVTNAPWGATNADVWYGVAYVQDGIPYNKDGQPIEWEE